jgi:molybdate transport system substrate-binding protein
MKKTLVLAVLLSGFLSAAGADEIRVLSGGAAKSFVDPLAARFKPHSVNLEYQPMGKLVQSLKSGVPADMVIVSQEALDSLQHDNVLAPGSGKPLARVGIGIAINEKAPVPDISTPEALKRTLLAAKSVVYIDPKTGTSGRHVVEVFKKLGIEKEMEAKASLGTGGYITEPVGRGEIEIGIHQISEILPVKGVRLAGPLPAELQKYTVYVAAPVPGTAKGQPVVELIAYLSSAEARARLSSAGYSPPE